MFSQKRKKRNKLLYFTGFVFSTVIFSVVLYMVLHTFGKIPKNWDAINILILVCWGLLANNLMERYEQ